MKHIKPINEFFDFFKKNKASTPFDYDYKGKIIVKLVSNPVISLMGLNPEVESECLDIFYNNGFNHCEIGGVDKSVNVSEVINHFNNLRLLNKDDLIYKLSSITRIALDHNSKVSSDWVVTRLGARTRADYKEGVSIHMHLESTALMDIIDYLKIS